jgi:proteasome lid subunit RPN8/RPN11
LVVTHPGPATAELAPAIRAGMIEHARRDYPNEACGVIVGSGFAASGGQALRFIPTRNEAASPSRFLIDADDLYKVTVETDDNDQEIWAIVHSHTHTQAKPSPTDLRQAYWHPDALHVLISLAESEADPKNGEPSIRAWRIVEGESFEVTLE